MTANGYPVAIAFLWQGIGFGPKKAPRLRFDPSGVPRTVADAQTAVAASRRRRLDESVGNVPAGNQTVAAVPAGKLPPLGEYLVKHAT
jgi:hypothetical protein